MTLKQRVRALWWVLALVALGLILVSGVTLSLAPVSIPAFIVAAVLVVLLLWAFEWGVFGTMVGALAAVVLLFVLISSVPKWQAGLASVCFSSTCGNAVFSSSVATNNLPPASKPASSTQIIAVANSGDSAKLGNAIGETQASGLQATQEAIKRVSDALEAFSRAQGTTNDSVQTAITVLRQQLATLSTQLSTAKTVDPEAVKAQILKEIQPQLDALKSLTPSVKPPTPVTPGPSASATPPAGATPPVTFAVTFNEDSVREVVRKAYADQLVKTHPANL
jgi:hypothetical protein